MTAASQNPGYKQLSETTAPAPNWKALAASAWDAPSWKEAAREYHAERLRKIRREPSEAAIAAAIVKQNPRDYAGLAPTFAQACRKADAVASLERPSEEILRARQLLDPNISLERAYHEMLKSRSQGRAAASTVEALMYGLRDGIHALPTNPKRLRRLSELNADQLKEVCARLQNFKPTIARPWTADEVDALVSIWAKSHA